MLGGITVVLYGMIGLLGAKIWNENKVDFGNPVNLVPIAAGIIIAIGNVTLEFTDNFTLTGIALGTIVTIVAYHLARALAPRDARPRRRRRMPSGLEAGAASRTTCDRDRRTATRRRLATEVDARTSRPLRGRASTARPTCCPGVGRLPTTAVAAHNPPRKAGSAR